MCSDWEKDFLWMNNTSMLLWSTFLYSLWSVSVNPCIIVSKLPDTNHSRK